MPSYTRLTLAEREEISRELADLLEEAQENWAGLEEWL